MEYRKFGNSYVMRIDKGEEIVSTLKSFIAIEGIDTGVVSGLGAVNVAEIGLFNTKEKKYYSNTLEKDMEITALVGNISKMNGEPYLHLHITLTDMSFKAEGGHLTKALVSGTAEITITAIEGKVNRKFSEEIGLNLYKFD